MHVSIRNNTELPCTPYPVSPTGDIWQNSSKYHNLNIGNDHNWLMLFSVLIYLYLFVCVCVCVCVCCLYECENWGLDLPQFTQASMPRVQSTQSLACHHWQTFLHPQDHQGPHGCAWQWAISVTLPLFYISLRCGLSGSFALHGGPYCHASHIRRWRRRQGFDGIKEEV